MNVDFFLSAGIENILRVLYFCTASYIETYFRRSFSEQGLINENNPCFVLNFSCFVNNTVLVISV